MDTESLEKSSQQLENTANNADSIQNDVVPKEGMSKNQMKRLIRAQKRQETKAEWRRLERIKRKMNLQAKKEACLREGISNAFNLFDNINVEFFI